MRLTIRKLGVIVAMISVALAATRWPAGDPATCRLDPGQMCIAAGSHGTRPAFNLHGGGPYNRDGGGLRYSDGPSGGLVRLWTGDRIRILADDDLGPLRRVLVRIESGWLAGRVGDMSRASVRPIARGDDVSRTSARPNYSLAGKGTRSDP
jgi:hypothetical protein